MNNTLRPKFSFLNNTGPNAVEIALPLFLYLNFIIPFLLG